MRGIKKLGLLVLLLAATLTLLTEDVSGYPLPISSYAQITGNWQGSKDFDEGDRHGHVDYAVYDRDYLYMADEQTLNSLVIAALGDSDDKYLYAYQIYNDTPSSLADVEYFQVFDENGDTLDDTALGGIGAVEDNPYGGIDPSEVLPTGIWKFDGSHAIVAGDHSCFMVFTTDFAPVAGSFAVIPQSDFPGGPTYAPEPATIALLGVGVAVVFARRKKSVR